jgi:hypothetical protein
MPRPIKFRAWDSELYEMSYSDPLDDLERAYSWFRELEDRDVRASGNIELMQYTGLKDKNGIEIYEGDIVRLAGYGDYLVEWPFIQLFESSFEKDIGEILGNIYENPELLKEDKA